MKVGEKTQLKVEDAKGKVRVSSTDSDVVQARYEDGKVTLTAKESGTAEVQVQDKKTRITVAVTVSSTSSAAASLSVSPSSVTLAPGAKTT